VDSKVKPYPHQLALHQSTCQNLAAIGGNGSGKSAFLLWQAILNYALRYEGCDSLLLRRNSRELDSGAQERRDAGEADCMILRSFRK